jgi:hypothetical protein
MDFLNRLGIGTHDDRLMPLIPVLITLAATGFVGGIVSASIDRRHGWLYLIQVETATVVYTMAAIGNYATHFDSPITTFRLFIFVATIALLAVLAAFCGRRFQLKHSGREHA